MEYYKNESGQIAVLVSPGFGAGWSTCNCEALAYDKRVVEYWLSKKDDKDFMRAVDSFSDNETQKEAAAFFNSIGYTNVYLGGFNEIEIVWVEPGVPFIISEYDGSESLETINEVGLIILM